MPYRNTASRLALLTAAAAGSLAAAPTALAAPQEVVLRGAGLSAPSAVAQTPDGSLWVADARLGVCRVQYGGVAEDLYCSDNEAGELHSGPINTAGLVFDAATNHFYAGDGQSNAGAIWRLRWDPDLNRIVAATRIAILGDDRAASVALAPGAPASVLYTTKRTEAVMEIAYPAGTPHAPVPAGFAQQKSATGLAVLDGDVYVAESSSVTRFSLASGGDATTVPGTDGIAATALAADPASGRVYAGTSYPGLTDDVVALEPGGGVVEDYERGFAGVTGLGVDDDGDLLVADDPGLTSGAIDSFEQGRLFSVPKHALRRGQVTITGAPDGWSAASEVTFGFAGGPDTTLECRLDWGEWTACDDGWIAFPVEEGTHLFEVRATNDAGTGEPARRVFVIDRTAPEVTVTAPAAGAELQPGTGDVDMVGTEAGVTFACALDGGEPVECEPGQELPLLAAGSHELRVEAVDPAGNRSALATVAFRVVAPPASTPAAPVAVATPRPAQAAVAARAAEPASPAEEAPAEPVAAAAAAAVPAFVPRQEIASAAAAGPRLVWLSLRPLRSTRVRAVRLDLRAGDGATTAHVTVRRAGKGGPTVAVRDLRVRAGARNRLVLRLGTRLRPGRYVVRVSLRGAGGASGNARTQILRVTAR